MKTAFKLAGVALACCTSMAMAVEATASLQLTLPALDTGNAAYGPGLVDGDWTGVSHPAAYANAQDAGQFELRVNDIGSPAGPPGGLGEARAEIDKLDRLTSAVGDVRSGALYAHAQADDGTGAVNAAEAAAFWYRAFSLDPGASFTFAGLASFASDTEPAALMTSNQSGNGRLGHFWAEVGLHDVGDIRNGYTRFNADVFNSTAALSSDVFSLGTDEQARNGLFSITVRNTTNQVLNGQLRADVYAHLQSDPNAVIAAPVPEPATMAMMFAGLGLIGSAAAKRRKQQTQQ